MNNLEMRVGAIGIDEKSGDPIVVLKDDANKQALVIWIGMPEARAITLAANKIVSPRPLTHDLLFSTIKTLGHNVKEIVIDGLSSQTYTATVVLAPENGDGDTKRIDSRPSDAIALALTAGAPVMVSLKVLDLAGIPVHASKDKEAEEFSDFVSSLKASDFKLQEKIELPSDEDEPGSSLSEDDET